ncbi:acylphosphatase [bacterium]|jgi:acylphosphatase|nr:acylphosphatase [bacterium]
MKRCISFRVTGRVQGVGYRYFAYHQALELGISGVIRNEADDSVTGEAQGSVEALEEFLRRLNAGPSLSRVDLVESRDLQSDMGPGFHIET